MVLVRCWTNSSNAVEGFDLHMKSHSLHIQTSYKENMSKFSCVSFSQRTCNDFVLQMANFYSKKIDCKEIPPKHFQMIPMSLEFNVHHLFSSLKCIFMINFGAKCMSYQPHLRLSLW